MLVEGSSFERRFKAFLPAWLKKFLSQRLANSLLGKLVKLAGLNRSLLGGRFCFSTVTDSEAAKIWLGLWESAELRMSLRHLGSAKDVIELGSSVGVCVGLLSQCEHANPIRFFLVEASPVNFKKLAATVGILTDKHQYFPIHAALHYGADTIEFVHTTTLGSKIGLIDDPDRETDIVRTISLGSLVRDYEIDNGYMLIADIEGAELALMDNDQDILKRAATVVMELEELPEASIEDQVKKVESLGFFVTERYGNVVAFKNEGKYL